MKLTECYIENFGKISARHFDFTDGFNLILAENGYGKTTLSFFIKCMLYGMDDTKKQNLDENERKKYLPWSGAECGGSLCFSVKDKHYRVERRFAPKAADDSFVLYDTALGRECNDFTENLGAEILGIDADGFMRTLFLSEREMSQKNDNRTISAKLSELVGCDGDISSMTEALKLLDEQRKFYMKKGGSGEISDIKKRLSKTEELLSEAYAAEERSRQAEKDLFSLSKKEELLREEERKIAKEREMLARLGSAESYRHALSEMKSQLAKSETRRNELIEFFGGNIPTEEEIYRAKMIEEEIKRLSHSAKDNSDSEFISLHNYFEAGATSETVASAAKALERLKDRNYPKSDIYLRKALLFSKRIPEKSEAEAAKKLVGAEIKLPILPLALGAIILVAGIALGIALNPLFFAISLFGIGGVICAPLIRHGKIKKRDTEVLKFISSLSDSEELKSRPSAEIIEEILALLDAEDRSESLALKDKEELIAFTALFGERGDPINDTLEILRKHERYKELMVLEKYKADKRMSDKEALMQKRRELQEFISRFRCKTDDPVTELSLSLNEYSALSAEIVSKRTSITSLTSSQKLSDIPMTEGVRTSEELDRATAELSEAINEVSRERALIEKQYRLDGERAEMREELLSEKGALEERYEKYIDNLETVMLTKKYLESAKENMTSKYLGKTKSGFEKYSSLISGEQGSFDMDTSFAISKTEGSKTHPAEAYSRGMRDLYGIAVRFALIDSLYENEEPFVILDDPFISLDDEKCKKAIGIIKEISKGRQIIYFTCSESRA